MNPASEYLCKLDMEDEGFWQGQLYFCFGEAPDDKLKFKNEQGFIVEVPRINFERVDE